MLISIPALAFYMFSGFMLIAAGMVITARNAVHSVLFLILAFFNAAGLFVLANAEFLAMMLIVVYVGAVAVLFLFVVMMLNVTMNEPRQDNRSYFLVGAIVGGALLAELLLISGAWMIAPEATELVAASKFAFGEVTNSRALGQLLYTHYVLAFQGAGVILLIAMIGAIVLTLRQREGVRKQDIHKQLSREASQTLTLVDMPSGKGVDL